MKIFQSAVAAVQPSQLFASCLSLNKDILRIGEHSFPMSGINKIYIIGAGKAAAAMAVATEKILGRYISDGLVITKYGHSLPSAIIKMVEGAHPIPDENCVQAVKETLALLENVTKNDIVICLLSGGASALWCDLPQGISLMEMQKVFAMMVRSGAPIHEINSVRKHLSSIKGGQLIRYCRGARLFSLIISDVPGDDTGVIASGPTVGDRSTFGDAYNILLKYDLLSLLPEKVRSHIEKGIQGMIAETPDPEDVLSRNTVNIILGSNRLALKAAEKEAKALGYTIFINPEMITGDTASEAVKFVVTASEYAGKKPGCILQGGETTIKVTGKGKGGRNQHFSLVALQELLRENNKNISDSIIILSGGTDGTDGPTDAAGAIVDNETAEQVLQENLPVKEYLENNDAYHFFKKTNGLIITGPTQTNVMDIMIAIIGEG